MLSVLLFPVATGTIFVSVELPLSEMLIVSSMTTSFSAVALNGEGNYVGNSGSKLLSASQ